MRTINAEAKKKLEQFEGLVLYAYDDFDPPSSRRKIQAGDKVAGTLTIGYGHTGPDVKPGMQISKAQAQALLAKDLVEFEKLVDDLVLVDLNDNQFGALVLFAFNIGGKNFKNSTLLRKLNQGDYAAVPGELMKWTKSKGKTLKGLVNRRAAEAGLWSKGAFVQSSGSPAEKEKPGLSKEVIAVGTSIATGAGSTLFSGTGPIQWALAAVMVMAAATALGLFVKRRMEG